MKTYTQFVATTVALTAALGTVCSIAAAQVPPAQVPPALPNSGVQVFSVPGSPTNGGVNSPPSTIRMTETPQYTQAPAPAMTDSPQSVQMYQQCRSTSDRAAVGQAAIRAGAERCLQEFEARRQDPQYLVPQAQPYGQPSGQPYGQPYQMPQQQYSQ
jgi:hypothetical protein